MNFKKGDTVICVNNEGRIFRGVQKVPIIKSITLGKTYKVIGLYKNSSILIKNDQGRKLTYSNNRFKDWNRYEKLKKIVDNISNGAINNR